jgi:predicted CoA-binding protein
MGVSSLPSPDPILELLTQAKTIAVVGLSDSPLRPSYGVSAYMQAQGYKIIPVNPMISEALGEKSYASPGKDRYRERLPAA